MKGRQLALVIIGAVLLVVATAAASTYIAREKWGDDKPAVTKTSSVTKKAGQRNDQIVWDQPSSRQVRSAPVQTASVNCDDGNIVGKAAGGVVGGLIGSRFGKGNGKTATTIGGTLGGAYVGGQYIPTHNATCR